MIWKILRKIFIREFKGFQRIIFFETIQVKTVDIIDAQSHQGLRE